MRQSKPKMYRVNFVVRPHEKREMNVIAMSYGDIPAAIERHIKWQGGASLKDVLDITFMQYLSGDVAISSSVISCLLNQTEREE